MSILDDMISGNENSAIETNTNAPIQAEVAAMRQAWSDMGDDMDTLTQRLNAPLPPAAPPATLLGRSDAQYRNVGKYVGDLNNNVVAIMDRAEMNWKTVPMALQIKGRSESRDWPEVVALVRSDNGKPLAPASTSYKPHHNSQIMSMVAGFAEEAGMKIERVGLFDGGVRGFAICAANTQGETKVGDVTGLRTVVSFGHTPGTATTVQAWAQRLVCGNGMTVAMGAGRAKFVHSAELSVRRVGMARQFVARAEAAFRLHIETATVLQSTPSTRALDLLMLAQLFQPELAARIQERIRPVLSGQPSTSTPVSTGRVDDLRIGAGVIARIMESDASTGLVQNMVRREGDRLLSAIATSMDNQVGGMLTKGTMAHMPNAVSYYNSNIRGRSAETGLEANLFGTSQKDTQAAFLMAAEMAETVRQVTR